MAPCKAQDVREARPSFHAGQDGREQHEVDSIVGHASEDHIERMCGAGTRRYAAECL